MCESGLSQERNKVREEDGDSSQNSRKDGPPLLLMTDPFFTHEAHGRRTAAVNQNTYVNITRRHPTEIAAQRRITQRPLVRHTRYRIPRFKDELEINPNEMKLTTSLSVITSKP